MPDDTTSHSPAAGTDLDLEGFLRDLKAMRQEIDASLGEEDLAHLRKVERLGHAATALGLLTAAVPNPLSMAALAYGRSTRWLLMHHIGHRGYDKVPGVPAKYTSRVFARGKRRFFDWADWMVPEAWIYEHNVLHHGHTGEDADPDLIERNAEVLRDLRIPRAAKYAAMGFLALTWRSFYYAPNTMKAWRSRPKRAASEETPEKETSFARDMWMRCYLPYGALQFVGLPLVFAPLGPLAVLSALVNSLGAEALTNLHTFLMVGPNHTGDDLYRFTDRPRSRGEAMLRQVLGSANYPCGSDAIDLAHLWLNYQVEHHIWPDLPMLRYREVQPKVKALCAKYRIPYIQESVLTRAKKMLQVAVGATSMKRAAAVSTA